MNTVFYYKNKATGELLGYHLSTFCQLTSDKNRAKVYECETQESVEAQKEVISKNLGHVLSVTEDSKNLFDGLKRESKKEFKGLTFEEVELCHEQL